MKKSFLLVCAIVALRCDGGLSPTPPPKPGLSGTIRFASGTWPGTAASPDSLSNLWIFASQQYPLDSAAVFNGLFSTPPTIFLYPSIATNLPFYVDSIQYTFEVPVGFYKYIGVIQHVSTDFSTISKLRVVGFAADPADTTLPLQVMVRDEMMATGVNINVNFHHPPVQPF